MRIVLTAKAKAFLDRHQAQSLTVELVVAGGSLEVSEPMVNVGRPMEDLSKYDRYETCGYTLHVFKGAEIKQGGLTIDAKRFFWIEHLTVDGIRLA